MTSTLLLDLNKINELKEMLEDDFNELLILFKENSREHIDDLKVAHEENNVEDILKYAHSLKGASGSLGLQALFDLITDLEHLLRKDATANVNSKISDIELTYSKTLTELVDSGFLTI